MVFGYYIIFYWYYRFHSIKRIRLLEIAIFTQMIGYFLAYEISFLLMKLLVLILTSFSLFIFIYLVYNAILIKNRVLFLIGPLFLIPYWIVLVQHLSLKLNNFPWLMSIRLLLTTFFISITTAFFAQKPNSNIFSLLFASLLVLSNFILYSYDFFGMIYLRYEITLSSKVSTYLIIRYLIKNQNFTDTQNYTSN